MITAAIAHAFDAVHAALAALLLAAAGAAAFQRGSIRALRRRIAGLGEELSRLKGAPERLEYRMERFDAVWFPAVVHSPKDRAVLQVVAGLPHCRACVEPLSASDGEVGWTCRRCGARLPASLADLMVTDSIAAQAMRWFQERHPGWRLPAGK